MTDHHDALARMWRGDSPDPGGLRAFLAAQAAWLAVTVPLVTSFGIAGTESLFVLAFVGWLSACVLFRPASATQRWWRISVWVTRVGFVALGYVVFLRARSLGLV